jgi:hypothetical protein
MGVAKSVVNGMCDELLSCAGFPFDEDSRIKGGARTYDPREASVAEFVAIEPGIRKQPRLKFQRMRSDLELRLPFVCADILLTPSLIHFCLPKSCGDVKAV